MSNPAELLSMLTTHGINLQHIPGGRPSMVALDIAAALGMMHDRAASAMLLGKYTMDPNAMRQFGEFWSMVVDRRAYTERWQQEDRTTLLAQYAYAEWLDAQRCRTCKGVAQQMTPEGKIQPCPACDGIGLRKIGDRPVAKALGMSNEGYRKSAWPSRIMWCRDELRRREAVALAALAMRLTSGHPKAPNV